MVCVYRISRFGVRSLIFEPVNTLSALLRRRRRNKETYTAAKMKGLVAIDQATHDKLQAVVDLWKRRSLEAVALQVTARDWHRTMIGMYKAAIDMCIEDMERLLTAPTDEEIQRAIDLLMAKLNEPVALTPLQQMLKEIEETMQTDEASTR